MELLLVVVLIFVFPVLLVTVSVIPFQFRIGVLVLVTLFTGLYLYLTGWQWSDLGFRTDNVFVVWWHYVVGGVAGVVGIKLYAYLLARRWHYRMFGQAPHFLLGFIVVVSLAQQLLFFGFLLTYSLSVFGSVLAAITLVSLLFMYLHIVYPNLQINLPLAGVGGVLFCLVFITGPNFYLATLLHIVLNATAVTHGFFVLKDEYEYYA
ncbi:MAG: CPBP family glutamic-type intramembrane protease [Bacteroidota bacterium]